MAEAVREREVKTPEPVEKGPVEVPSRVIRRAPSEAYGAIDPLSRGAEHVNMPSEATYRSVSSAARAAMIAQNVQSLNLRSHVIGAGSLPERFKKMMQALE